MSVTRDIWRSWRRPLAVYRELLRQGPREDRALGFLMIGCGLIFLAQWPRLARMAQFEPEVPFQTMLGGALFGWLFLAPLFFYLLAAVLRLLLVAVGQRVSWYAARLVVFWGLLALSPAWLLYGLVGGVFGPGTVTAAVGVLLWAIFLWIVGSGLVAAALEARGQRA